MKKIHVTYGILVCLLITSNTLQGQKRYNVLSSEMIFAMSDVQFTPEFTAQYPNAELVRTNLRFTFFFHLSSNWHYDFTNNFGLISGLGIRNLGLITDEKLPDALNSSNTIDYKIVRRAYTLGIPLALKVGSFSKHLYFFGGGEYEWAYVYKEKFWTNTHNRDGSKTKEITWLGNQTPAFLPSVFAGVQMPKGINIRFKYYPNDFINNQYRPSATSNNYTVSDLSRYATSKIYSISICWQFKPRGLKNSFPKETEFAQTE